jgi:serine/threonine protein kinase/WD40 repeat protein
VETHSPNIDDIFLAALDRENAEQRSAFLDEACAGNADLRRRVDRLLDAQAKNGSFLEAPAPELRPTVDQSSTETPGTVIGPYKLLEQIGEGGMGTVWMAEQKEPIQRRVAVKVIKAGMDSKQVLARFEAERQALALMDHPNIARVLDAGTTGDRGQGLGVREDREDKRGTLSLIPNPCPLTPAEGRPYFVMELVKGTPITQYCDDKHLTVRERLELFGDVCRAVQHAHQKGIIHRDLKPSNILIAPFDGKPVPKIIDFGVAKATGQRLTDATLVTGFGAVVGTPEYMSPEQAETNNQDIDTRSDIYSLGVLLYELLTGSTPLTKKRVKEAALLEVLRVIREEEPPRPSTRLSSTEELPSVAAQRHIEPAKLTKLVRGELDWIVMKALEKDRNRRYETANGFAMDVQHYLADEPVAACPPSAGYRLRKYVQRHKVPVLAGSSVLLALVVGIIGTTWGLIRATNAEADAVSEAQEKEQALKDRTAALAEARQSEGNAKDQLFLALWSKARALRFGGQAGQRFDGLKTLAEAGRIALAQDYGEEQFVKLRSEAIACLALPDLRFERTALENVADKVPHSYWIAFDPGFRYFGFIDLEGNCNIHRVADGKETARLARPEPRAAWFALRFSPDGRWLLVGHASSGQPLQAALWEFRDGKPGRKVVLEHWCDFSPDSQLLAGPRPDGSVGIYEVVSGQEVKRVAEGMRVVGVRFYPDGRQLAVSVKSDPRVILVLDRETGKEVARYVHPQRNTDEVAWSGDGRLLAVPCSDQRIHVWDHAQRRLQSVLEGHAGLGIMVQFSHAGDFLLSTGWDGTVRLWDPVTGRQLVRERGSHLVAIRRDDRQVALVKASHLELWEFAGGWECRTLHHGQVGNFTARPGDWGPRAVAFSPDGRLLASGSLDGARLWDLANFTEVGHLPAGPTNAVLFHADGSSLFTNGTGGLQRWPIRREMKRPAGQPDRIAVLQVGPPQALDVPGNWLWAGLSIDKRGRRLSAVDYPRGRVIVLDLNHPGDRLVLEHPVVVRCEFSPDGRWALTHTVLNGKGDIKIWDTSDGKPVNWQPPAGDDFQFFTLDGRWLVTRPPGEAPLRFWQVGSWQPGPTLPNPIPPTLRLWPLSSGALLGLPSGPEPVWLIHAGTGKVLATLEPPRDIGPTGVAVSPDGTRLAVGTSNHTIHVWDLRAVRRGLAEIGLDWDQPPYPPADRTGPPSPLRVEVQPAKSAR